MKKKNFAGGATAAAGTAAGAAAGAAFSPQTANGAEIPTVEVTEATAPPAPGPEPVAAPEPAPTATPKAAPMPHNGPMPETKPKPAPEPEPSGEVEVVGYDRVTNPDGSAMDIAVLDVNDTEMNIIDVNLNGEADFIMCDLNGNGTIDNGEVEDVRGQGIDMRPLQEAAGFSTDYAQDTLPDYVNDAEVDTYMA